MSFITATPIHNSSQEGGLLGKNYCSQKVCKLPPILVPPALRGGRPLGQDQLYELYKYKKSERKVYQKVESTETLVNKLADDLRTIRSTIEEAFQTQLQTQIEIEKCPPKEEQNILLQLKWRQQQELMECLKLEDKYLKQLHCAQRAMREAHIDQHSFGLELVDKKIDTIYQMYKSQKDVQYQHRLYRECSTKTNTKKYQFQAMKNYLATSIDQKIVKLEHKRPRIAAIPDRIRHHIRNSHLRHRHRREETQLKDLIRQNHQRQNLIGLKQKIDEQKQALSLQNVIQKKRREDADRRRERRRQELIDQGENPYVVDELMKVQEKLHHNEIQAMHCRALALQKIEREVAMKEQKRRSKMVRKRKWDEYWAKKVSEKKRQHYNKYIRPFLAQPSPASRSERWLKAAQNTYGYDDAKSVNQAQPMHPSEEESAGEEKESLQKNPEDNSITKVKKKKKTFSHGKKSGSANSNNTVSDTGSIKPSTVGHESNSTSSSKTGKKKKGKKKRRSDLGSNEGEKLSIQSDLSQEEEEMVEHVQPLKLLDLNRKMPLPRPPTSSVNSHKGPGGDGLHQTPVFSWSPKIISFKNFDVGKVYKMKVLVTNKSKQRVKYYFKELTENESEGSISIPPALPLHDQTNSHEQSLNFPVEELDKDISNRPENTHDTMNGTLNPSHKNPEPNPGTSKKKKKKKSPKAIPQNSESGQKSDVNAIQEMAVQKKEDLFNYKLTDLIKIDFTIPAPISPGLQHSFLVKFIPKVLGNWSGNLHFRSEMESFSIPIEIRKKIFSPELELSSLTFTNTVVQTSVLKKFKIKNVGGLPGVLVSIHEPNPPKHFGEIEYPLFEESIVESSANEEEEEEYFSSDFNKIGNSARSKDPKKKSSKKKEKKRKDVEGQNNEMQAEEGQKNKKRSKSPTRNGTAKSGRKKSPQKGSKKQKKRTSLPVTKSTHSTTIAMSAAKEILHQLMSAATDNVFLCYVDEMKRKIKPGESLTLSVLYRPPFVSHFVTNYDFGFEQESGEPVQNLMLDVTGMTLENPVYIQPLNGDFKICSTNQTYQLTLKAFTTSHKGSGKVTPKVPPLLRNFVEVFPHEGTIFATHPCQFTVRFSPKKQILNSADRYVEFFDPETSILDFPVYFHLKFPYKVPSPIKATFMVVITDSSLIVEPLEIDMGLCLGNETVKAELTIRNPTAVIQQLGFVDVPEEILIQPNYGFSTLFPNETITLDILLSVGSKVEGVHIFQIKLQTFAKEEYTIKIRCRVRSPIAKLSHNKIFFPVTSCGSTATTFFSIKAAPKINRGSNHPGFIIDKSSVSDTSLTFSPDNGYIEPGKEVQVLVTFQANVTSSQVKAHFVELARRRYNERISSLQRELSSINLHIQNDWMLEDNPNLSILHSRTASLLSARISNPILSAALQKIAVQKLLSKAQESQAESDLLKPSPRIPSFIKSGGSSRRSKSSRDKTSSAGSKRSRSSSQKSKKPKNVDDSSKDEVRSNGSGESESSSTSSKKKSGKTDGKKRDKNRDVKKKQRKSPSREQTVKQQLLATFEKRKISVKAKLEEPFIPPDVTQLSTESVEFARTKRDLMRNLVPTSNVIQVPVFVQDGQLGQDTLYLTVKCPVQKPDLILLDDSSVFDFRKVQIGSSTTREVSLYNISFSYLTLKMDILDPYGPFVQINALRSLAPEHVYTLKIRFTPQQPGDYEESIVIRGMESKIPITLKGSGEVKVVESAGTSMTSLAGGSKIGKVHSRQLVLRKEVRRKRELLDQEH